MLYDPMVNQQIGCNAPYPSSYWANHTEPGVVTLPLRHDIQTDVAVIGAGYTGLSCAFQLAKRFSREVVVLDAHQTGWGCSGRNAGFVLRGTGRLGMAQLGQKFGIDCARLFFQEYGEAITLVEDMMRQGNITCQAQPAGYLKVAHNASLAKDLPLQAEFLQKQFGYKVQHLSAEVLRAEYMHNAQAYGAIRFPDCFGVNPLALVQGYGQLALAQGVKLYTGSPVLHWQRTAEGFILHTPEANVHCKQLVMATNAYTAKSFYPTLNKACLPVLSSVIVTKPLTEQQILQTGLNHTQLVMDTRALKYYYRKLPDNRILFGGRSAVHGKDAANPKYPQRLLQALKTCFPVLQDVSYEYHWSGWVAVSFDDLPRVVQDGKNLFYAAGYCGSGVSFSTQAGRRLAELAMGLPLPELPIYQTPLRTFPLAAFRRLGQQAYYQWGRFKDRYL